MATVQDPVKAPNNRHERFVQQQLTQATRRVRFLDFATAGLGLLIAALAYGLAMIFVDRWLHLPQLVRQVGFVGFLGVHFGIDAVARRQSRGQEFFKFWSSGFENARPHAGRSL